MGSSVFDLDAALAAQQPAGSVFDLDAALAAQRAPERSNLDILGSSFTGLGKSAYNTFAGATQLFAPIMERLGLGGQFPPLRSAPIEPEEEIAAKLGNIAQFLLPGGPVKGAAGAVAQGAKAGGLSLAQGETGANALLSSILGGAGPAVSSAGPPLKAWAKTQYGRALGATTQPLKAESERVVPQLLEQRVSGSLKGLQAKATAKAGPTGAQIRKTYEDAARRGVMSDADAVAQSLDDLKVSKEFIVAGKPVNPAAVRKIDELKAVVQQWGSKAPPDVLWKVRKSFDDIVGGGFGQDLTRGTAKAITRDARAALQKELNKADPNIESLNAVYGLWEGLRKVTTATLKRETGQKKSVEILTNLGLGGGASALLGGGDLSDTAGGAALWAIMRTPRWRTVSAVQKYRIADLLAKGQTQQVLAVLSRLGAATAPQAMQ